MNRSQQDDADFDEHLRQALENSQDATDEVLGQLLEVYRPYLLQIANEELDTNLRGKAGGSDLVQQTFLEANKDIASFRGKSEAELRTWLRQILLHNLANFRRQFHSDKRDVHREVVLDDDSSGTGVGKLPAPEPSPGSQVLLSEDSARIEIALHRLPDDYRQVIVLRHQQRQSFAEIGAAMGRSAEAARKLWARAIEALQAELKLSS